MVQEKKPPEFSGGFSFSLNQAYSAGFSSAS